MVSCSPCQVSVAGGWNQECWPNGCSEEELQLYVFGENFFSRHSSVSQTNKFPCSSALAQEPRMYSVPPGLPFRRCLPLSEPLTVILWFRVFSDR